MACKTCVDSLADLKRLNEELNAQLKRIEQLGRPATPPAGTSRALPPPSKTKPDAA